jgi:predicted O-methyltransferase YrrM
MKQTFPTVNELLGHTVPYSFQDQYWTDHSNELRKLIREVQAQFVIEVGCWTGHTTACLARFLPPDGCVLAVDPWHPFTDGVSVFPTSFETAYWQFLSNVHYLGFGNKVQVLRKASPEAANEVHELADIIFVDGAHDTPGVFADLNAWWGKLNPQGILCGDDWFVPSVRLAVKQFAAERRLTIQKPLGPVDHGPQIVYPPHRFKPAFWSLHAR